MNRQNWNCILQPWEANEIFLSVLMHDCFLNLLNIIVRRWFKKQILLLVHLSMHLMQYRFTTSKSLKSCMCSSSTYKHSCTLKILRLYLLNYLLLYDMNSRFSIKILLLFCYKMWKLYSYDVKIFDFLSKCRYYIKHGLFLCTWMYVIRNTCEFYIWK